jgi:drug/metabolite transporter (DMT)-like permease
LLYLLVFGSLVGFVCYIYALHHLSTTFVALYTYVNPIVAVTLGAVVLGEEVGWRVPAAIATVLAGMATVSWRRPPMLRRDNIAPKPPARSSHSSSADETYEKQHYGEDQQ